MSLKWILLLTPVVAILFVCRNAEAFMRDFLRNDSIPLWLVIFGSSGQILFTLRFLYQFYYSRRRGQSVLPAGFWILSLTGSLLIVIYGCIRLDAVLIVGQSVGFVAYIRNLYIGCRDKKNRTWER